MQEAEYLNLNDRSYKIYALVDPRDNIVRYVGMSTNIYIRFHAHLGGTRSSSSLRKWLVELQREGLTPLLQILETISSGDDAHSRACEREQFWINKMFHSGSPLFNKSGVTATYFSPSPPKGSKKYKAEESTASPNASEGEEQARGERLMSPLKDKLYTVKQVAEFMSVDETTVRGWIQRGDLKAINIGRKRPEYRIRPADLEEFIRVRETDQSE